MSDKSTSEKARVKVGHTTIAATRIIVSPTIETRTLEARNDKPARTLFSQSCILIGGSKNIAFEKTCFEKVQTLDEGVYMFSNSCFRMGKYDLEINPYENWVYIGKLTEQHEQLLKPTATTAADIF